MPPSAHHTRDTKHLAPSARRQAPSKKHQAPSTRHQAPDINHHASSTRHLTPSAKLQAPSTKRQELRVARRPLNHSPNEILNTTLWKRPRESAGRRCVRLGPLGPLDNLCHADRTVPDARTISHTLLEPFADQEQPRNALRTAAWFAEAELRRAGPSRPARHTLPAGPRRSWHSNATRHALLTPNTKCRPPRTSVLCVRDAPEDALGRVASVGAPPGPD